MDWTSLVQVYETQSGKLQEIPLLAGVLLSLVVFATEDLSSEISVRAGVALSADLVSAAGLPRVPRYAMSASISSDVASTFGMPPAFIFALGLCSSETRRSLGSLVVIPTRLGARAVPAPSSPWQALQPRSVKTSFPL